MQLEIINGKSYQYLYTKNDLAHYLSTDNKLVVRLERCPYCGNTDVISHHERKKMCDTCGKELKNYQYYKHLFHRSDKYLSHYTELVNAWYAKHQTGLLAPSDITEQKAIVEQHKAFEDVVRQQQKDAEPRVLVECYRCGQEMYTAHRVAKPICRQCEQLYTRYKALRRRVAVLTIDECAELRGILKEYIHAYKNDGWCPTSSDKLLDKLRRREHELGM